MWTDYTARAVRDAQGQVLYYEGSLQDITSRKEAEEELRQHRERLAELVEERTAELRESEERYRTLFDGVPTGLYRSTPEGQLLDANPAMVQMLGYASRGDLLAVRSPDLYVHPGDRERWGELMAQEGVVRDFECQLRTNDGRVIWAEDTARAMRDKQGQVLYYEGSVEDITERKRAEAELQEYQEHLEDLVEERTAELRASEERYRTLFDGVPVGLYRTTPEGQVLDASQGFVQMAGYPDRETLLAMNTGSFYVDPEQQVQWKALMEQSGIVRDFEAQGRRYDGTVIWFSDSARAVRDQDGEVLYYEGSLEDITERKVLEEEIRRQKEYFEALFVGSPAAAMTTDMEANIASWNPMAEKLFGYTQEEAVGRHVDDLVATDPNIRDEAREYTEQAISEGRFQSTARRTRKDGSYVDVEVSVLPVVVGGERTGFVATYHDVSELQQARREAEAANQAKSVFLANMSHELRTPLNAILGFSQLMEGDANLTAEQQDNMGIINRSGEHLLALINDVLEMSKIEAGRLTVEENSFDLHELLDGLEQMFRLRAEAKRLTMTFRRAENVPRYVAADEGKLRQVLGNLLGNAVKFTQEGGVALRVSSTELREPGGIQDLTPHAGTSGSWMLRFEVEDTGPGIAPEDLEIVFEPFIQATSGPPQEGTGLGLSISRQFARLMGGDLTVRSELGQGSLFRFDVRVALSESAEVEEEEPRRQIAGLAPDQRAPDGGPYRLLVAEDRETNRLLLVRLLQPLGFEVREAANGQEAVELWQAWRPHLIWMDMRMPVMDGCEATRRIKAMPGGQDTAIIALTATVFEEDRERILLEGCDDFVRKPFRKDEIYDALAQHLGVRFVYEEEPALPEEAESPAAPPPGYAPSAQALAALPAELLADLQQATIRADLHQILILIEQVRAQDPVLADALSDLAENYDYQRILDLIQEARRA
jgi:PAS domain S-box-containing protein